MLYAVEEVTRPLFAVQHGIIEWTKRGEFVGSKLGVTKIAAKRLGLSLEDYLQRISDGLKWCTKCKSWKSIFDFGNETARGDGKKARCKSCDHTCTTTGPSRVERRHMLTRGLAYCRDCSAWLPVETVRQGRCAEHHRAYDRLRYSTDEKYRAERRQHVYSRKRGVAPIPADAQESIREEFDGLCAYCDAPGTTWDHVVPVSKGGETKPYNVVPACVSCNSSKGTRDVDEWVIATGRVVKQAFIDRIALEYVGLYP